MSKCICCGAAIPDTAKMCRACYDTVVNNPCKDCTAETGRTIGCQATCTRMPKWRKCYDALMQLRKSIRSDDYRFKCKRM